MLENIRATNHAVVAALGMQTGITHAEYMVVGDTVYLVEIAARGGGRSRVYSHIAPYLAGAPITEFYLKSVMGETMDIRPDGRARAANLAFFDIRPGTVRSIAGLQEARAIPGSRRSCLSWRLVTLSVSRRMIDRKSARSSCSEPRVLRSWPPRRQCSIRWTW